MFTEDEDFSILLDALEGEKSEFGKLGSVLRQDKQTPIITFIHTLEKINEHWVTFFALLNT